MPEPATVEQSPFNEQAEGADAQAEPLSLDSVFNPPVDDAAGATHSQDGDDAAADQAGAIQGEGDQAAAAAPVKGASPKSPEEQTFAITYRGQEFQVPAALATLVEGMQLDHAKTQREHAELLSEFTRRSQGQRTEDRASQPSAEERAKQKQADLDAYDGEFLNAIDNPKEGRAKGMSHAILELVESRLSDKLNEAMAQLVNEQIRPFQESVQASLGDQMEQAQIVKQTAKDLTLLKQPVDLLDATEVHEEFKAMRREFPNIHDRDNYNAAFNQVLIRKLQPSSSASAKKPDTLMAAPARRPAAPNAAAPRPSGTPAPPIPASGVIHRFELDESLL